MLPVLLTRIKTSDGVMLDGLAVLPKRKNKTALVWLHGLTSKFYGGQTLIKEISRRCQQQGIGYFKFNTRGHDIVTLGSKGTILGSGFERFGDCVLDIRAIIGFCKKLGYRKTILIGHSTGANKALYYLYKTRDRAVKGLALLGPMSDVIAQTKLLGKKGFERSLATARRLSRADKNVFLPHEYGIYTAKRYLSLYSGGTSEDVFPYHNSKARWKELRSVRIPVAVIFGSRDEHLDRPAKKLIEIFRANAGATQSLTGMILKGANHGFYKKEKELAQTIISWLKRAVV